MAQQIVAQAVPSVGRHSNGVVDVDVVGAFWRQAYTLDVAQFLGKKHSIFSCALIECVDMLQLHEPDGALEIGHFHHTRVGRGVARQQFIANCGIH